MVNKRIYLSSKDKNMLWLFNKENLGLNLRNMFGVIPVLSVDDVNRIVIN